MKMAIAVLTLFVAANAHANLDGRDDLEIQVAEKSDAGLKRILSRPQPLKPKEPKQPAHAQLPGDQKLMPSLDELRGMNPKLIEQLRRLQRDQDLRNLPKKSEASDSELQVAANSQSPDVIRIPAPVIKMKNMDHLLEQLRKAPSSGPTFEIPVKKSDVEYSDAADASS